MEAPAKGKNKTYTIKVIQFHAKTYSGPILRVKCYFHPILHHVTYSRDSVAVNIFHNLQLR